MKKYLIAIALFCLPTVLCRYLLKMFMVKSHMISKGAKVGFSFVVCDKLQLGSDTKIGFLNYINIKELELRRKARIRHFNILKGPIYVFFDELAWIHSQNKISGPILNFERKQKFSLGKGAQVMVKCLFDVTGSIQIGDNTTLAGAEIQMWTHAFYVGKQKQARLDGGITIGDNCYIGARVVICSGVSIVDSTCIGANSTVSKSIQVPGLYVNQPLRYIEFDADKAISNLTKEIFPGVFEK